MKNLKIALISIVTLLSATTNIQTMGYWEKMPNRIKIGFTGFMSCMCSFTLEYCNYKYSLSNETAKPFQLTPSQRQNIKTRFNKYRTCTELNIIEKYIPGAAAAARTQGSKCKLYLPPDFFLANSPDEQDAIIAHEATHFSQNHSDLKPYFLKSATQGLIMGLFLNNRLLVSALDRFPKISLLTFLTFFISVPEATVKMYLAKREKDADLLQKTPEELLNSLKRITKYYTYMDFNNRHIVSHILNLKKCPSFLEEQRSLSQRLTIPHALRQEAIEYFAHQFEKQVTNPAFDDFPRSEQECKKALSCYFHHEKDYAAGKPYIDHPLIHKRVALLREHLKWHQSKEA